MIECSGTSSCITGIQCPDGFACRISCTGQDACKGTTIACPANHACDVECNGTHTCRDSTIVCGALGVCSILCEEAGTEHPCEDTTIICGENDCNVACTADEGKKPIITPHSPSLCEGQVDPLCLP